MAFKLKKSDDEPLGIHMNFKSYSAGSLGQHVMSTGTRKRKGLSEKVTTRLHDVACRNLRIVLEEIKKGGCSSAVALFGNGQRAERVVLIACWQHLAAFKSEDSSTGSWIPCLRSEQGTVGCCTSYLPVSPETAESDSRPLEPFLVIGSWPSTALTSKASPAGRAVSRRRRDERGVSLACSFSRFCLLLCSMSIDQLE